VKRLPRKHPVRYATTLRLERAVYANAARLFLDACMLYTNRSFPSAYALAILALEEVGKIQMMDHVCFEAVLNDGSFRLKSDRMDHLFSRSMFYCHPNKQAWGIYGPARNGYRQSSGSSMIATPSTDISKIPFTLGSLKAASARRRDLLLLTLIVSFATFLAHSKSSVICHFTESSTNPRDIPEGQRSKSATR
jgi:AbiV